MEYEDRMTIQTPEGVDLELTLAGLGSRIAGAAVDRVIQWVTVLALWLALILPFAAAGLMPQAVVAIAVLIILYFIVEFGYHAAFETLWSGRTPGKRVMGLRVLRADGHPIRFREAVIRGLVLILDGPLTAYAAGSISILLSSRNQRLGDIVAGTVVTRERVGGRTPAQAAALGPRPAGDLYAGWDVGSVTSDEVATLRSFLERRDSLTPEARARVATQLASRLRGRVVAPIELVGAERFIEAVVAVKLSRR